MAERSRFAALLRGTENPADGATREPGGRFLPLLERSEMAAHRNLPFEACALPAATPDDLDKLSVPRLRSLRRELARRFHPDVAGPSRGGDFARINAAIDAELKRRTGERG